MRVIAFIENEDVIKKILKHLGLWDKNVRSPPKGASTTPEFHIDFTNSQLPASDDYLFMDPEFAYT